MSINQCQFITLGQNGSDNFFLAGIKTYIFENSFENITDQILLQTHMKQADSSSKTKTRKNGLKNEYRSGNKYSVLKVSDGPF